MQKITMFTLSDCPYCRAALRWMDELTADRTSFVIAHRLSTIKNADCILYVDKGDILERGNHDALMEQKGEYYKLYMSQYDFLK